MSGKIWMQIFADLPLSCQNQVRVQIFLQAQTTEYKILGVNLACIFWKVGSHLLHSLPSFFCGTTQMAQGLGLILDWENTKTQNLIKTCVLSLKNRSNVHGRMNRKLIYWRNIICRQSFLISRIGIQRYQWTNENYLMPLERIRQQRR